MLSHLELARLIGTNYLRDSKVDDYLGKNVRCPSLIPGTLYIMKEWSVKHHCNSDNPFQVVKFIGSGREVNGERVLFAENPAIKEMNDGDYYYFEAIMPADHPTPNQPYIFGAYMFENCVCITSSAVRVTCYAIGKSDDQPKIPRKSTDKRSIKVLSIDSDEPIEDVEEDYDDMPPDAVEVHPISMIPYKRQSIRS